MNFVYAHMTRAIKARELSAVCVTGPGHRGPGLVANTYLEGTYSEAYPHIERDDERLRRLRSPILVPRRDPEPRHPGTSGSIHEGGELGYALLHAYGAAFDNPALMAVCVVGDGEAETGPMAASWPRTSSSIRLATVTFFPVLHLNGYKIANPTVLARIPRDELDARSGATATTPALSTALIQKPCTS